VRVTERFPKSVLVAGGILASLVLAYAAFSRPGYFTSETYLGGLLLLELLIVAVWMYRRVFFAVVIVAFLLAGVNLPVGAFWTAARWLFLSVGALAGSIIMLKERGHRFNSFHTIASFAVLTALVSAAVSRYPDVALLKVLSFFLLFLYAGTGARLAVSGRQIRFFNGLLIGCEIFVAANAFFYGVGIEAMGNPNSLGAVMGVVCAPLLLWSVLRGGERSIQLRRGAWYAVCMSLCFVSHARAGLAAALVSSGLLCLALRKYKLAIEGTVVLLILVAAAAIFDPDALPSFASSVVYKGGDQSLGMLASRESPWHAAVDSIRNHPWFGTGLGTTMNGLDANEELKKFASSMNVTAENGSSYLAIISGVGVLGIVPFFLLLLILLGKVFRTVGWMRKSGSAAHPAIPLAMVMVAGMVHAAFEDWMFAPGSYLCVFYWSLAFILLDVGPAAAPVSAFAPRWHPRSSQRAIGVVAPNR
jgi:O-antigen ligase